MITIKKVLPTDPRLPEGSKGIALPNGEVLYTTPETLGHELAHVKLGHPEKWKHGEPRGDVMFWQEMDAYVYSLIMTHFDGGYQALMDSFFDECKAKNSERLFYTRKSVSRLLKRGAINLSEATAARSYLIGRYK